MRLCTYIVKRDKGLAPNPFWGYCTLALCTPNHMGIKLATGDWIAGFSDKESGNKLVYCMQVDEVLGLDQYYRDKRYERKKPVLNGTSQQRVGDNMYWLDNQGKWKRDPEAGSHVKKEHFIKDTRHALVYIGRQFYYLGRQATEVPPKYLILPPARQGVKTNHEHGLVDDLLAWVQQSFKIGIVALPSMFEDIGDCGNKSTSSKPNDETSCA
jgi:hypothetical protein